MAYVRSPIQIRADAEDDWTCQCGNRPDLDGFQACDIDGVEIEPTVAAGWTSLYACQRCPLIVDVDTYDPIGHTIASVIPGLVIHGRHGDDLAWTDADQALLQRFRDARAEVEETCEDPLGGDVVEFGDGVRYRLAYDGRGLFAAPICQLDTEFEIIKFGGVRYNGPRALTDIPIDPDELQATGRHLRVASIYVATESGIRIAVEHRARVLRTDRVAAEATLTRIRALTAPPQPDHAPNNPGAVGADDAEVAALWAGLDAHLTAGGELPTAWAAARAPAAYTAREITLDRLTEVYAEELAELTAWLGSARVTYTGGTNTAIEATIGTAITGMPAAADMVIVSTTAGLASTRPQIVHWLAQIYPDGDEQTAIGHSLHSARDAVTAAIENLRQRRHPDSVRCGCQMVADGDSDAFTADELADIRASYRELLTAQREASLPADYFDTVDELADEIELRDGTIVHENARGTGLTVQFVRRGNGLSIRAFHADHGRLIAELPWSTLTGELINQIWTQVA